MKKLIVSVIVSAAVFATARAQAGCSAVGAWIFLGNDETPPLMATFTGNANAGTYEVEVPSVADFPDAARISTIRGVWERTDGNTVAVTEVVWALDGSGNILYQIKYSGSMKLVDNCTLADVNLSGQLYAPNVNPFTGEPLEFPVPPIEMTGYRMSVQPPPPPPQN